MARWKRVALVLAGLFVVAFAVTFWWAWDRPFGGAVCWVNFHADSYEQAKALEANLDDRGLKANVSPVEDGRPLSVTVKGGFWKTEGSLEHQTLKAVDEVGAGAFDQCNVPSLGD